MLIRLEGHHLQGYGDGSKTVKNADSIVLLPGAAAEADAEIAVLDDPDLVAWMERVAELAEGFESAYGMELLATVHWFATRHDGVDDARAAAECVRGWSSRKERPFFADEHVAVAWDRLQAGGWLTGPSGRVVAFGS